MRESLDGRVMSYITVLYQFVACSLKRAHTRMDVKHSHSDVARPPQRGPDAKHEVGPDDGTWTSHCE